MLSGAEAGGWSSLAGSQAQETQDRTEETEESAAMTQVVGGDAHREAGSQAPLAKAKEGAPPPQSHAERFLSSPHHVPRKFMFAVALAVANLQNKRRAPSSCEAEDGIKAAGGQEPGFTASSRFRLEQQLVDSSPSQVTKADTESSAGHRMRHRHRSRTSLPFASLSRLVLSGVLSVCLCLHTVVLTVCLESDQVLTHQLSVAQLLQGQLLLRTARSTQGNRCASACAGSSVYRRRAHERQSGRMPVLLSVINTAECAWAFNP